MGSGLIKAIVLVFVLGVLAAVPVVFKKTASWIDVVFNTPTKEAIAAKKSIENALSASNRLVVVQPKPDPIEEALEGSFNSNNFIYEAEPKSVAEISRELDKKAIRLISKMSAQPYRACERREFKKAMKDFFAELENMKSGITEEYVTERLVNYLIDKTAGLNIDPIQLKVKLIEQGELEYTMSVDTPCGEEVKVFAVSNEYELVK
ncbi:MAG: hypothetical protein MI976_08615 [Pseudomonadales bacterium]|nr:hypothetical protein [Pseudomonadales bacterium]